jgi:hypothetical protein
VVAQGTPEQVAEAEGSFTGKYLKETLGGKKAPAVGAPAQVKSRARGAKK